MVIKAPQLESEIRRDPLYRPVEVKPAHPSQVDILWGIHYRAWGEAYPNKEAGIAVGAVRSHMQQTRETRIQRMLDAARQPNDTRALFAAHKGLSTLGSVNPNVTHGLARIDGLYVEPDAQGQGAGSMLLNKAIKWHESRGSERVHIFVAQYLDVAQRLYEGRGFEIIGESETSYKIGDNPIPEYEMVLENPR